MSSEKEVAFYRSLLSNLLIQTLRFDPADPPEGDLGLRRLLGLPEPKSSLFPQAEERTVYHGIDSFGCSYNWLRLPDTGEILVTGPYLTEEYTETDIMALLERYRLPPALLPTIQNYYKAIPYLAQDNLMSMLVTTLAESLWSETDGFMLQRVSLMPISAGEIPQPSGEPQHETIDLMLIEARYESEHRLMHAVSHGQTRQATRMISAAQEHLLEQRSSDRVRNFKNYGIVLNTLLRKAAEEGGVHPLHLDRLSSKSAHRLEQCLSSTEIYHLFLQMVESYCELVRTHSLNCYSPLVRRVILRIESDLTADLGLHAHAAALNVNASYLSAQFRRETGKKLTDFVNQRRIEHAAELLRSTKMQVQTIAQYCGIPDVNYFSKLFRRLMGATPSTYRGAEQS